MAFCYQCGKPVSANAKFCPYCGFDFQKLHGQVTPVSSHTTEVPEPTKKVLKKEKKGKKGKKGKSEDDDFFEMEEEIPEEREVAYTVDHEPKKIETVPQSTEPLPPREVETNVPSIVEAKEDEEESFGWVWIVVGVIILIVVLIVVWALLFSGYY